MAAASEQQQQQQQYNVVSACNNYSRDGAGWGRGDIARPVGSQGKVYMPTSCGLVLKWGLVG